MKRLLFAILRFSGLPVLFRETLQRRKVTILLFHDLTAESAEKAFSYLSRKYRLIGLDDFLEAIERKDESRIPRKALIITFDDGVKENYALLPLIREHKVPVTIFLCAGIVGTNRHFWFLHDSVHNRENRPKALSNTERLRLVLQEGFEFEREYETRQALSRQEIKEMKPLVRFESHSRFHPNVLTSDEANVAEAFRLSKKTLEEDFDLNITAIAYPCGDHSDRIVELAREAGYRAALTHDPGFNTIRTDPFRLKRIPANDSFNRGEIAVRASGVWDFFRMLFTERLLFRKFFE
ncbi:MAG: polysaccharide deacetylase family protein [Candidatus Aminicenantes bacterium]|nr:polysaccharide deacetylase family protein [Candidatus Aminicenantes bacterium]